MHRNTRGLDVPQPLGGVGAIEGNVTQVHVNAFTININSINGNTLIKADFLWKKQNLKQFLDF